MPIIPTCTKFVKAYVRILCIFACACLLVTPFLKVYAQEVDRPIDTPTTYALGKVLSIVEEGVDEGGTDDRYQIVLVQVASGVQAGEIETVEYRSSSVGFAHIRLEEGDSVVLSHSTDARGSTYAILDQFRLPVIFAFALIFGALAIVLGRWRGTMSLVGLGVSLIVLTGFVVPHIMNGDSPVLISAIGATAIAMSSLFLAHGFTKRTLLAFSATMFVLIIAFVASYASVIWAMLSGASSEEAVFLQMGYLQTLDLRGLLMGGLVIGALGVLDDVTTAQVAAVEQISRANRSLDIKELYLRGIEVGREHIASLVNTLALAYVGASFPLFLLFSMPDNPPLWVILNGESIVEELLRALIGGSALILAVPVSTALAAWAFGKGIIKIEEGRGGVHVH